MQMKSSDHQIGYKIKAAREAQKMTQEELAEAAGISSVYLAEIENKRTIPSFKTLCSICSIINLSLDDLSSTTSTTSEPVQRIVRLLSRCNEKQLKVIYSMIEAMLRADL